MNISDVIEAFEKKAYPVRDGLKFSDLGPCQARDSDGWLQAYRLLTSMTEGYCLRPISPPKGKSMPQTVEHCHAVMARDMELILEQKAEISKLKSDNNIVRQKLLKERLAKAERIGLLEGMISEGLGWEDMEGYSDV